MTQKTQSNTRNLNAISNSKNRIWVFTLNNYTEKDIKFLLTQFTQAFLYAFQEEIGDLGNHHLQGVVKWKNAKSFRSMQKLHKRWHLEKCNNLQASIHYCLKEESRNGRSWQLNTEKYIKKSEKKKTLEFNEFVIKFRNIMIRNIITRSRSAEF